MPEVNIDDRHWEWRDEFDRLHRLDGPALVYYHGSEYWYVNGLQHRLDGPAYIRNDGSKKWCVNGEFHRLDGPAIEWVDGSKYWYVNGLQHRIDGPAIEWTDGTSEWWIEDRNITSSASQWVKEQGLMIPFDEPTQMMFLMKFG